jgi:hypothetical protein
MPAARNAFRVAFEVLGSAVWILGGGFALLFGLLGTGSVLGVLFALAGYLLCIPGWFVVRARCPHTRKGLERRLVLDCALLALLPAVLLGLWAYEARVPFDLRGARGHGWGLTGSELNLALIPWLHAALWWTLVGIFASRYSPRY